MDAERPDSGGLSRSGSSARAAATPTPQNHPGAQQEDKREPRQVSPIHAGGLSPCLITVCSDQRRAEWGAAISEDVADAKVMPERLESPAVGNDRAERGASARYFVYGQGRPREQDGRKTEQRQSQRRLRRAA